MYIMSITGMRGFASVTYYRQFMSALSLQKSVDIRPLSQVLASHVHTDNIPASRGASLRSNCKVRGYHSVLCRHFKLYSHIKASTPLIRKASNQNQEQLISQMNIRLLNESSFLSWCRNAYLSTVVGVAMLTGATTALSQGAGLGALVVGTMNLLWGTGCHITNLIRLRHVSGMSGFILCLNLLGSALHCLLWSFALICYIGFLDEMNMPETTVPDSS